jgi:hypothetical protein
VIPPTLAIEAGEPVSNPAKQQQLPFDGPIELKSESAKLHLKIERKGPTVVQLELQLKTG